MKLIEKYRARLDQTKRPKNDGVSREREASVGSQSFKSMLQKAMQEINWQYEPGTIPYIRENHPALWQKIVESENRCGDLWLAGEIEGFRAALGEWRDLVLGVIETFRKQGTQKTLFDLDQAE